MKKILIVEDDGALQQIYREALSGVGYDIHAAATGQQALSMAQTVKPELIILDIMLPEGMNGFDVVEQLQIDEELKKIPVIMLTNVGSEKDTATAMGVVDYIVKANTSIDEVVAKVKKVLED